MHRLKLLIFAIGIILSGLAYAEDEDSEELRAKRGMVLVEPGVLYTSEVKDEYALLPYRERRPKWGSTFALGYSTYEPVLYEPDFAPVNFADVYKSPDMPMIELQIVAKRNFKFGSLGAELGVGMYSNDSDNTEISDSSLTLIPVRLGLVLALDTIAPEPIVVPYVGGGAYTMIFREELTGGNTTNGNTQAAMYFHGGLAFQLDWMDRAGARLAFQESGIESTYAYVEAQSYTASSAQADGDFSSDVSYAGGIKVEF